MLRLTGQFPLDHTVKAFVHIWTISCSNSDVSFRPCVNYYNQNTVHFGAQGPLSAHYITTWHRYSEAHILRNMVARPIIMPAQINCDILYAAQQAISI
jgi:hypothetical protein